MDLPDPTERRDRLIAALLAEDPETVMIRWDAEAGVLLRRGKETALIHLITAPADLAPDRLEYLFSAHIKRVSDGAPPTHFVVVGGGPEARGALKKAAPFVQRVPMGFHHLDDAGRVEHVTGRPLPALERAAERAGAEGALDPQIFAEALARGQQLVNEERAIAAKLGGRRAVTAAITAACLALAALAQIWDDDRRGLALWALGANNGAAVTGGEVHRLFASAFLHANVMHLAVNLIALWSLGPMIEAILGPRRYILLYGASALAGSIASAFFGGERWSVGASGAIWGLMAASIALAVRPKGVIPTAMAVGMRSRAFAMLALNVLISFKPGIDLRAHFGGGAVGFVLMATVLTDGLIPLDRRATPADAEQRRSPVVELCAAIVGAAMVASVIWGVAAGRPWEIGRAPALARAPIADTALTIEVPDYAARKPQIKREGDHTLIAFGSLHEGPVAFELIVAKREPPIGPDEMDGFLDQVQKDLSAAAPPKWVRKGEASRVMLGARPGILVEHEIERVVVRSYFQTVGAHDVLLRAYIGPGRPASWAGIEAQVAASIRP